jgi:hypothetical protein
MIADCRRIRTRSPHGRCDCSGKRWCATQKTASPTAKNAKLPNRHDTPTNARNSQRSALSPTKKPAMRQAFCGLSLTA